MNNPEDAGETRAAESVKETMRKKPQLMYVETTFIFFGG